MSDYGMKISAGGSSVEDTDAEMLMTTKYPFMKLDTTLQQSFQTILLTISTEPPAPAVGDPSIKTLVYRFAHGYDYVPEFWALVFVNNAAPVAFYEEYFYGNQGIIGSDFIGSDTVFNTEVDDTYVNFYVTKSAFIAAATDVAGTVLEIRSYVFVDGVE